jgi:hypothetical protein
VHRLFAQPTRPHRRRRAPKAHLPKALAHSIKMDAFKRKTHTTRARATQISSVCFAILAVVGVAGSLRAFQVDSAKTVPAKEIRLLGPSVFAPGETLKYRVHYGFLTAGEATLSVANRIQEESDRPCYKVEIEGRSVGAFNRIVRIRDRWGTYLDTALMKPHRAVRDMRENKYRLDEDLRFDYAKRIVSVKRNDRRDTTYKIPSPVYDIVSGYYFLRQIDFNAMPTGTVVVLDAFFDNQQYKFKVRFVGRETIKTKFGRVPSLVLSPIMPDNSFFDGENAIRLWMSDDVNRVPVKCSAELAVGSVDLDLTGYQGTRANLATVRD